jgi:hypothetical protein
MKKVIIWVSIIALSLIIKACCMGSILADLATTLGSGLARTFVSGTANSQIYNVANDFANVATDVAIKKNCSCADKIEETKSQTARWNIYYNTTSPEPSN